MLRHRKIFISKTPKIDTRQGLEGIPSIEEILVQNYLHIRDVQKLYHAWNNNTLNDVVNHDWDKLHYIQQFRQGFVDAAEGKVKFSDVEWYRHHLNVSRHHALDYTGGAKIHLGHIVHMACDWIAAEKARGRRDQKIDVTKMKDLLWSAWNETLEFLRMISMVAPYPDPFDDSQVITFLKEKIEDD